MTWVLDKGLAKLRDQVDAEWPDRDKSSDGTIGNAAHAAGHSDHNPEHPAPKGNPDYQVDAMDLTHDPKHGADMQAVADAIVASRDRRVSYLIHNHRIVDGDKGLGGPGIQPWIWRAYTGTNPHEHHLHISVRDDTHDQTQDWEITDMALTEADLDKIADRVLNRTWKTSSGEATLASRGAYPAHEGDLDSLRRSLTYGGRVQRSEDRALLNALITQSRTNGFGISSAQGALSAAIASAVADLSAKIDALSPKPQA